MPIEGSAGTLDIENATLRSNAIAVLTNLVTGNDRVRESGAPALEVYGDPSNGGNEARLEMVSNTATVSSSAFTRLTSNAGVLSIKTGTDASDNGTITFGGFANERLRITSDGNVAVGTTNPSHGRMQILCSSQSPGGGLTIRGGDFAAGLGAMWVEGAGSAQRFNIQAYKNEGLADPAGVNPSIADVDVYRLCLNPKGGNVGIGAVSPEYPLDVKKSAGDIEIRIEPGSDAQGNESGIRFDATFEATADNGPRRAADLRVGYNGGAWGTEYMSFRVGTGGQNDVQALTTERMHIKGNGNVGIGTNNPRDLTHIRSDAGNGVDGLLIEANNTGTGSAALRFGVAGTNETTNVGIPKAGIFFKRSATNGRGDLLFCIDNVDDTSSVGTSDVALKITAEGYVQPGQINTRAGSLKGNYFFQGIYDVYRSGGLSSSTTYSGVYERWVQVVRMGSLLTIFGGMPLLLTSTVMNLQFTWAELGLDEPKSIRTLINQSDSTSGTWGNATANSTYLTLPSTGHTGNGTVDYNNVRYVIDLSFIYQY